jgi:hypothetical protein
LTASRATRLACLLLAGGIAGAFLWRTRMTVSEKTYVVGIPGYWATLTPPLQHSLLGFGVMVNQFEPLVKRGRMGLMEPLAARSWEVAPARTKIRFHIDTSRRFSDSSPLCAEDFKRSWEDGLRLQPKSANSSLADGLGSLKGFSSWQQQGGISGVKAVGTDILELEFEKPVRIALEHLSGVRFSAYKMADGKPIGTGPYVITENDKVLTMAPNPHFAGERPALRSVKMVITPPKDALASLRAGDIDAFLFAETAEFPGCAEGKLEPLRCAFGQEGTHLLVSLNGLPDRFFSDIQHRQAFQALLLRRLGGAPEGLPEALRARGFSRDPQSFLKFQSGRLPEEEAQAIIRKGERHIARLLEDAARRPLRFYWSPDWAWLRDLLIQKGVKLSNDSREEPDAQKRTAMYYKTFEPDILPTWTSVYDGDPDGLYHMLGKNGAIFSPVVERKGVVAGMESGRQLTDIAKLAPHYEGVSRTILEEIPYVHLGYFYRGIAYNADRLRVNESLLNRNNHRLTVLEPK